MCKISSLPPVQGPSCKKPEDYKDENIYTIPVGKLQKLFLKRVKVISIKIDSQLILIKQLNQQKAQRRVL